MYFKKILVTTDFSDDSKNAFDLSSYEEKMEGSDITLLSVIEETEIPVALYRYIPNPESITNYKEELIADTKKKLEDIAKGSFHKEDVDCQVVMTDAGAANEICDFAKRGGYNLIVMASHGRGATGSLLLGSVVQKVLRHAPCPVLVVPKVAS
ncbi:MAG: universal stress protein [Deltaproteobacteria bacterium]|nr:universal stress protein [Deltaproteobacteria bacterium]